MTLTCPVEIVRLMFEARAAGDVDAACTFLHPEIRATTTDGLTFEGMAAVRAYISRAGAHVEVYAHRIEQCDDGALAYGRVRVVDGGSLVDSPAAWRFRMDDGLVRSITPVAA